MITDEFLLFFFGFIATFIDMLPVYNLPTYSEQALIFWSNMIQDAYKLNGFVPISAIFQVLLSLIVVQTIVITIKLIRMGISLATGGGGAT